MRKIKIMCSGAVIFLSACCFFSVGAQQPFRYDNVSYKAVYWNDAIRLMNENKDYLLIDVRTPGEYADTAQQTHMDMGRIKGAVNINIDSFSQHLAELKRYRDENIFVYCSHSQRSRRVSKLLSDSGFTKVYNINGGMSVANESGTGDFPLKRTVVVNNKLYKNIASTDALHIMQLKDIVIIDIRSKTEFNSRDSTFIKNLGHIKNAVNIPSVRFMNAFTALHLPKEKTILIYDLAGIESSDRAADISKAGYTHVYNLFEGLEGFLCDNYLSAESIQKEIVNPPPLHIIGVKECINLLSKPNNFLVIDARPADEFNNTSSRQFLNTGRIKNAANVSSLDGLHAVINNVNKNAPILVYGSFSSNNDADLCQSLIEKGYKNAWFLYQGITRFTWACFNIKNCKEGINILSHHDGLY